MAIHDDNWTAEFNTLTFSNITSIKIKEFFTLFFIQILSYTILCVNYRAVGNTHYHTAAISDFLIASLTFFVIRKIAHGQDHAHQWAGYALGSVIGSYLGIWISSTFLGG
jgi:uncharacterized membrane protein YfcA